MMARFWLALLLACQLGAATLTQRIGKLVASSSEVKTAFWGIQVLDLKSGRTLYSLNADRFFVPASNTKLFTTALALSRLGPQFTFQTRVLADQPPDANGTVHGGLRLTGGGDPNLSGRDIPYRVGPFTGDPLAAIADLADQLSAKGVRRVEGDIVGDDTWYVWQPYAEGWGIDDPIYDYGAPVSALTINDNTFTLTVNPGAHEGDLAAVTLAPPLEYYTIRNRVETVAASGVSRVHYDRAPGGTQLELWGTVALGAQPEDLVLGIEDPARYAALALEQALAERGITVTGRPVVRHLYPSDLDNLKDGSTALESSLAVLASRTSAPLLEDLRITDKVSQNLHAELALRAVGRARRNIGSREAGLEELHLFLAEAGIDESGYNINDGSGLSRLNLVTPATVVKLLRHMFASPQRENWISLLPVGGQDGTLSLRLAGKSGARIHAKTGSLSHVNALSGYAQRSNGEWVAFSILVNNSNRPAREIRGVMDRICTLIVE